MESFPKKKYLIGVLAIGTTSLLSFFLYKYFKSQKKTPSSLSKSKPKLKVTPVPPIASFSEPIQILSKQTLLRIISTIKKQCNLEVKTLRQHYRTERRKIFYDEDAYQPLIDEHNAKLLQIFEAASERVFLQFDTTQKVFDESLKYFTSDVEVSSDIESIATIEEDCLPPTHITKNLLLEIFNYNNKRCREAMLESNKNLEYLNTRIQDEIYFKYKIEMEELTACYKRFNCEMDPDFQPKIDEMQQSLSQYIGSE